MNSYIQEKMIAINVVSIFTICLGVSPLAYANSVGESCTITQPSQIANVVKSCTNIVVKGMNVPAKETLTFNLKKGSTLTFEGRTTFGFDHWYGPLIVIEGEDLKVQAKGSLFDGQGQKYWDGQGAGGVAKPSFIRVKGSGKFNGIHLLNCPRQCASIHGSHISIDNWTIDVSQGDKAPHAYNTDGFDISGDNIEITNSVVKNQDDCIAVQRGSNMHFKNLYCHGSHGLSLAAGMDKKVYANNVIRNLTFEDCSLVDAVNGIHVKTIQGGGPGLIENIHFNRIALKGITWNGIEVNQDYPNHDHKTTGNVVIKGLTISNVEGTMAGGLSRSVRVVCHSGTCSDWKWSNIHITGNKYPCEMNFKPSGFSC